VKRLALLITALAASVLAASAPAAPPPVQAGAYLVQNASTGEVLAQQGADERRAIASITKLMTVLVALDRADLDDVVTVTPGSAAVGESTIYLQAGERITLGDLARAALIQSANDAANAIAVHVGGGSVGRFVGLMNVKARELGLRDTHFANPSGLDARGHYSTARDVTRLARVAMNEPFVRETVRLRSARIASGRALFTWNDLLARNPRVIGVKTGHTDAAGWSQVAAARGRGFTIYATILGGATREGRNSDLGGLLAWGLSRYRPVALIDPGRAYATVPTGYDRPAVRLVALRGAAKVVHVERKLVERVVAPTVVELPVRKGQRLGVVRVYDGPRLLASTPLVAAVSVGKPGLGARVGWYARQTLDNLGALFS
jgi:D-alanyl-D-alanine carboxypeptidase (penicillin-binding protein 5/6)